MLLLVAGFFVVVFGEVIGSSLTISSYNQMDNYFSS